MSEPPNGADLGERTRRVLRAQRVDTRVTAGRSTSKETAMADSGCNRRSLRLCRRHGLVERAGIVGRASIAIQQCSGGSDAGINADGGIIDDARANGHAFDYDDAARGKRCGDCFRLSYD
jgi:hypothetical protein